MSAAPQVFPAWLFPSLVPLEGFWGSVSQRVGNASCLWLLPSLLEPWRLWMNSGRRLWKQHCWWRNCLHFICAKSPGQCLCSIAAVSSCPWFPWSSGVCCCGHAQVSVTGPPLLCVPWGPLEGPSGGGHCVCRVGPSWQGQCWCGGSRNCWILLCERRGSIQRESSHQTIKLPATPSNLWASSLGLVPQGEGARQPRCIPVCTRMVPLHPGLLAASSPAAWRVL